MDYSSLPTEDHQSPWGSSSPRAERTTIGSSTNDVPSSPLAAPQPQSPYNDASRQASTPYAESHTDDQESSQVDPNDEDPDSPESLSARLQSAQLGDEDYDAHEQPPYLAQQQPPPQYVQQQSHQGPARYQTPARTVSRNVPHYKLHAKITALERTGKKDPILRFDVHVSSRMMQAFNRTDQKSRPICPNSEPPSSVMFAEHIPNSSSLPNTSSPPIPKRWSQPCHRH